MEVNTEGIWTNRRLRLTVVGEGPAVKAAYLVAVQLYLCRVGMSGADGGWGWRLPRLATLRSLM